VAIPDAPAPRLSFNLRHGLQAVCKRSGGKQAGETAALLEGQVEGELDAVTRSGGISAVEGS